MISIIDMYVYEDNCAGDLIFPANVYELAKGSNHWILNQPNQVNKINPWPGD